jgi:hypothetical protein
MCGFKSGYLGWFGGVTRLLSSGVPSGLFGFGPGLIALIFIALSVFDYYFYMNDCIFIYCI